MLWVLLVGAVSCASVAVAALRTRARVRVSWTLLFVSCTAGLVSLAGVRAGWPQWVSWGLLRGVSYSAGFAGLLVAPGVRWRARSWGVVVLEGWPLAASALVTTWAALDFAGWSLTHGFRAPAILGTAVPNLFVAVAAIGMGMRTGPQRQIPVSLIGLGTLGMCAADAAWALTGSIDVGTVLWVGAIIAFGLGGLWAEHGVSTSDGSDNERPRAVSWSHVGALPGVVGAVVVPTTNPLIVALALSILLVGGLQLVALDGRNAMLWRRLGRQAATDGLTGLLNRRSFLGALQRRLRTDGAVVLFLDLDDFKTINDTAGHTAGDAVLQRVAALVTAVVEPGDLAARLGGDEFAVLPVGSDPARADELAARLVEALANDERCRGVGVSVGVVACAGMQDPPDAEGVLRDADLAMYEAKRLGGGQHAVFLAEMRERVLERARIHSALERACLPEASPHSALEVDVQPIVSLADGRWVGVESLVRWRDHGRRRPPGDFIPLAEETGLIVDLGRWVLVEAIAWLARSSADVGLSVNVAGAQLLHPGFADLVASTLDHTGIAAERLTVEVTEQTAVQDIDRAGGVLQRLRAQGIHVSLDDFGTGYSSLGYLAQLPVDELKIDRSFVSGLGVRRSDDALVRTVLGLADDLGLRVVAEGVETWEQASILEGLGCRFAQGYLFARPTLAQAMDPARIVAGSDPVWLAQGSRSV